MVLRHLHTEGHLASVPRSSLATHRLQQAILHRLPLDILRLHQHHYIPNCHNHIHRQHRTWDIQDIRRVSFQCLNRILAVQPCQYYLLLPYLVPVSPILYIQCNLLPLDTAHLSHLHLDPMCQHLHHLIHLHPTPQHQSQTGIIHQHSCQWVAAACMLIQPP